MDFNKNYDASVFETTIRLLYKVYYEFLISCPYPFTVPIIWNYESRLVNYVFQPLRVVGGLLSTYDLSGDKLFLDKAQDIADRLLPAWNTESGIPYNIINLAHGNPHNPGWTGVSFLTFNILLLHSPCDITTISYGKKIEGLVIPKNRFEGGRDYYCMTSYKIWFSGFLCSVKIMEGTRHRRKVSIYWEMPERRNLL